MKNINYDVIQDYMDFKIKDSVFNRGILIFETDKGKKTLKKSNFHNSRLLFIHNAKEHLYKKGFTNIDRYNCTNEGLPYFFLGGEIYTMNNYIEGRKADFDDKNDMIEATRILALLHRISKGYVPPEGCTFRNNLGKLPHIFNKKLNEIKKHTKIAKKTRSKFDCMFLEKIDYFREMGTEALKDLLNSNYYSFVEKTKNDRSFCHCDYTYQNIIVKDKDIFVTCFEMCAYELKVYDIANLIKRKMRKCNWNIKEANKILESYNKVDNITKDEFEILKVMLKFPGKFFRIANEYYNSKKRKRGSTSEFRLVETIKEVNDHKKFIDEFNWLWN